MCYMPLDRTVCSVAQLCPPLCDPIDCSPPAFSVHGVFKQEYWSRLPFPTPGDLPGQGIEPASLEGSNLRFLCLLHWQVNSLPLCHLGSPFGLGNCCDNYFQNQGYNILFFLNKYSWIKRTLSSIFFCYCCSLSPLARLNFSMKQMGQPYLKLFKEKLRSILHS